jgi:hypothetical protein
MIELDRRLRDYHDALVAGFTVDARHLAPRAVVERRRRRWTLPVAVAAAVAVAATILTVRLLPSGTGHQVTVEVPGFTIVAEAAAGVTPHLTMEQATSIALQSLARGATQLHISGFTVTVSTYAPQVLRVSQTCGAHIGLAKVANVWVIGLTAPPQHGWQFIRAAMLVDDDSGGIAGGQILTGPRPEGSLATCPWGT